MGIYAGPVLLLCYAGQLLYCAYEVTGSFPVDESGVFESPEVFDQLSGRGPDDLLF